MDNERTTYIGMQAVEEELTSQQEEQAAVALESKGYERDIAAQRARNSQLTALVQRLGRAAAYLEKQNAAAAEGQAAMDVSGRTLLLPHAPAQ